jgi:hypothetical protein
MENMDKLSLKDRATRILSGGPDRVVVNSDGEAKPSRKARETDGVDPDVIFIRKDGWSLGAPANLVDVAYKMWKNEWVGFLVKPEIAPRPMAEWSRFEFLFRKTTVLPTAPDCGPLDPPMDEPIVETMAEPPDDPDECYRFLDGLRESGKINMFGAVPYLQEKFPTMTRTMAKDVLLRWMETRKYADGS